MATYKVIQDIEAEDKLLGPLTLRQFIYAAVAAVCLYLCYLVIAKHVAFMVVLFLPPAMVAGFFAFPFGRDQPTELWALAKIRFMFKPHRRIWDQSGIKELVTITAPKKVEINYTDGLSQTEVKSRLRALADTIDSRGWVVKNVNVNLSGMPQMDIGTSDRLVDVNDLPKDVSNVDVQASDDMLDEVNNPVAQQFNQMIAVSTQTHRQQIVSQLKQAQDAGSAAGAQTQAQTPPDNYWFLDQPQPQAKAKPGYVTFNPSVIGPGTAVNDDDLAKETPEEKALAEKIKAEHSKPELAYSNLRILQPLSAQSPAAKNPKAKAKALPDPLVYELAGNNDLNVETIARQAKKDTDEDEVVIPLH